MAVGCSHVYITPNFKSPPRGRSWGGLVTLYITRTGYFCEISTGGLLATPPLHGVPIAVPVAVAVGIYPDRDGDGERDGHADQGQGGAAGAAMV